VPDTPATLPTFDAAAFRLALAGLADPDYSADDEGSLSDYRRLAVDLCLLLCVAFGSKPRGPLDRKTLWDRIDSGLRVAASKVDDGNTDLFLSLCLEHVFAVGYRQDARFLALLSLSAPPPAGWALSKRQGFVRYVARHVPAIVGRGSVAWQREKQENADARALEEGGTLSTGEVVVIGGPEGGAA
jgi:hypothetical protein